MKNLLTNNKTKKGFTLIEVLLATAILGVSLVVLFHTFSKSIRAVKVSQDYMRGKWLLQQKMSEFEKDISSVTEDIAGKYHKFPKPFKKFSWKVEIEEKTELKKISFEVQLPERSENRKIKIVSSYFKD